ncbi:MAG: radical SAM protein [Candidatus Omnitrophica bacterium]|nr:radical SAM protein [Candidatus Omnitrophota bacterium]
MPDNLPNLVMSDSKGRIYVHPYLKMPGSCGSGVYLPKKNELIPLPSESSIFYMPGYLPIGYDTKNKCEVIVSEFNDKKIFPASAFLIPGYTRLFLPAANKIDKKIILPLWPYTAVGWLKGKYWVCAIKIDLSSRQKPFYYRNRKLLNSGIRSFLKHYPDNRLLKHLVNCALNYNCRNSQNLFFGRWEAPLPISPVCNANCLGCLSFQDSDCALASHQRINFIPTPDEIKEVALLHLEKAREAIVSFGQGCEGEPLLQFNTLQQSIIKIRKSTKKGTIHLNTNAYNPDYIEELAEAGLNSVRISINSFREDFYRAYYRPRGYGLNDVLASVKTAKKSGLFVSLNLLVFPGLTDTPAELSELIKLLKHGYVDLLQLRNMCIDPDFYLSKTPAINEKPLGVLKMIKILKSSVSRVRLGYFNLSKERFNLS